MLSIPEARSRLLIIADNINDMNFDAEKNIRQVVARMYRMHTKPRRAKPTAKRMTAALAENIREYCKRFPELSNREIGRMFGVDGGRVSEALQGKK